MEICNLKSPGETAGGREAIDAIHLRPSALEPLSGLSFSKREPHWACCFTVLKICISPVSCLGWDKGSDFQMKKDTSAHDEGVGMIYWGFSARLFLWKFIQLFYLLLLDYLMQIRYRVVVHVSSLTRDLQRTFAIIVFC